MPRTILIVDDLLANRIILKQLLSQEYTVREAAGGEEALDILARESASISAVLLDVVMPGMNGYEVLRRVRESPALYAMPVIMITGTEEEDSRKKALALGANDFVMKPYMPDILKHCLRNNIALRETLETVHALQRDRLTGLYSRETFFERVQELVSAREPGYYVMACFDIDKFRVINDQYGAKAGDAVLLHVATVFDEGFNRNGGVCCRVAADNFAALYPAALLHSEELAQIRHRAANPEGFSAPLAFSIGRYQVDDLSLTPSAMYDRAKLAAESIKGRYDVQISLYDESMRQHLIHEQEIVQEMQSALAQGQFEPWFQPQYNHSTGALIGAEALVRWRHPQKGILPPNLFIPIFEQNGFVYEVDKSVWEQVCQCLRRWADEGRNPLPVSVNVSRHDVFHANLVDVIAGLVKKYGLPPELLRLEITESAFTESAEQIIAVVERLLKLGFTLEIDDFGSGYSSLNTLKDVPAQILKLDMKFLESGRDSQRGGNIVESIVRMAKWLDMSVIAEGVENVEQADFLRSIGCSYVQGYLYARPMPVEAYEALCKGAGKEQQLLKLETVENLNNSSFWDPASMDTFIFNSFVGGACIFEYHKGKIELLRATEKYAQVVGSAGMTVEDALALKWEDHLNAESQKMVIADLETSVTTRDEVTNEYVFLNLPGCPNETYLRSTMRVIAAAEDRFLVYCTNENITAQRQAEKREREAMAQIRMIMANVNCGLSAMVPEEDGSMRVIFSNDMYYSMLGYTKEQAAAELTDQFDVVFPADRPEAQARMDRLLQDRIPFSARYRYVKRDGSVIYVRSSKSVASVAGLGKEIVVSVVSDVTDMVEAERQVASLTEQLQAILDNVTLGVTVAVARDGRARFLLTNDCYYNMLGYTRTQYEAEINDPYLLIAPEDRPKVRREIDSLSRVGDSTVLVCRGVRRDGGRLWMRITVSSGRFSWMDEPVLLAIYQDVTVEKETEQTLRDYADRMETMMNDMPGGFVRIRMDRNGNMLPVYVNDGLCRLTGMKRDAVAALFQNGVMMGAHPDDRPEVERMFTRMLETDMTGTLRYRLRRGDGTYAWVNFFGRVTEEHDGERLLNVYFTDAMAQIREEDKRKELLDNLPCGAALYEYDGMTLNALHLNKRYWELVERQASDLTKVNVIGAIYPSDRAVILRELNDAIKEKRDFACDARILCGNDEYRPFRLAGRIIPRTIGKFAIYAAFSAISEETASYQQMLPLVLSAIMESTSDLTFVKDKHFRYVCASRAFARMLGLKNASEVVGETDYDLFEPATADKFREDDQRLVHNGTSIIDMVESIPSGGGVTRYTNTSKYLLRDAVGKVIGLYGVGRDVTEYWDTFGRLKAVTDGIPGGVAAYECTHDEMRMIYCNDGFCKLFGISRQTVDSQTVVRPENWAWQEDMPELQKQIDALVELGTPMNAVYRVHTYNGSTRRLCHQAVAAERHADKAIVYAVLMDVTERMKQK